MANRPPTVRWVIFPTVRAIISYRALGHFLWRKIGHEIGQALTFRPANA
jgi:hypothetical protein